MGCNNSKPITPFVHKHWTNPFSVIYRDSNQYNNPLWDECQDNIDEIQQSFDYATTLIDNENFNECNRKQLKNTMIHYKNQADNYVNFILKDKAGRLSKSKCKQLNEINKNIGYALEDWKKEQH